MDLEAKMAAALKGKFFWEPTTKYNHVETGPTEYAIREAQKKFRDKPEKPVAIKKKKSGSDPRIPMAEYKAIMLDIENNKTRLTAHYIDVVLSALSERYNVDPSAIFNAKKKSREIYYRHALCWLVRRYCPDASYGKLGRLLKRDHSTIINSVHKFELIKQNFVDTIQKIDDIVGYKE